MRTRKIIVILGGAASGKSTLLQTLAELNQKEVRYYGYLGVAHLPREPFEGERAHTKRKQEASANLTWYIDDVWSRKQTVEESVKELLAKTGDRNLVIATQDARIATFLCSLNPDIQVIKL